MKAGWCGVLLLLMVALGGCGREDGATGEARAQELVVYSARNEHLIKPLFDRFTADTGVRIRYVTDAAGPLLARLQAEGDHSPADILMTVDAGNLWQAAEVGILRPSRSPALEANVPEHLRDSQGRWFGLSIRARTIVYSPQRVDAGTLSTYEDLADARWRGRLCLRTSKKVYNQSLVATLIAVHGAEATEAVVRGWVENLAVQPFANDSRVAEAIALGQCDVGIMNTYYLAAMLERDPQLPVAVFWPNQRGEGADGRGVHINISGAGVTRASRNPDLARRLLEWLSAAPAQKDLAAINHEYPVNPEVEASVVLQQWGAFRGDTLPVGEAGRLQADAIRLMDRAGYR